VATSSPSTFSTTLTDATQRVLHRRFVESFLAECEATPADKRAIDADFAAPSGEACTLLRFFDIKERLSFERSRGHC